MANSKITLIINIFFYKSDNYVINSMSNIFFSWKKKEKSK